MLCGVPRHQDRPDEATQEMISAAHAAAIHWKAVGTALNAQRAEVLLATAYVKANHAALALHHAQRGLALSEEDGSGVTLFDRAMTLAACGKAHVLAGNPAEAERLLALAADAAGKLPPDDLAVFNKIHATG